MPYEKTQKNDKKENIFEYLDEFTCHFDDSIDPTYNVAKLYVASRLDAFHTKNNEKELSEIGEYFAELYIKDDISLDLLINALYNYINYNKKLPTLARLKDIEAFLEDYEGE